MTDILLLVAEEKKNETEIVIFVPTNMEFKKKKIEINGKVNAFFFSSLTVAQPFRRREEGRMEVKECLKFFLVLLLLLLLPE